MNAPGLGWAEAPRQLLVAAAPLRRRGAWPARRNLQLDAESRLKSPVAHWLGVSRGVVEG